MMNAEQVVIDIVAKDNTKAIFKELKDRINSLNKLSESTSKNFNSGNSNKTNASSYANIQRRVSTVLGNIQRRNSTVLGNIQRRNSTVLGNIQRRVNSVLGSIQRRINSNLGNIQKTSNSTLSNIQRRVSSVLGNIQRRINSVSGNVQRRVSTVLGNIQRRVSTVLGNIQRRVSTSVSSNNMRNSLANIQRRVSTVLGNIQRRVSTVGSNIQRRVSTTLTRIQQRVSSSLTRIYQRISNTLANIQRRVSTVLGNVQRRVYSTQSSRTENVVGVLNRIQQTVSRIASRMGGSSRGGSGNNSSGNVGRNVVDNLDDMNKGVTVARSNFHDLNTLMYSVSGRLSQFSAQIAGIFGASGLGDMIGKMWEGAAQRQQNMLYLIHQKGVEEANSYYDEIMSIVTQLPGDDTFLTNILNMSSALDDSLKLDNLKEAGTAITDYYMAATMKGENSYETQKDIRKYMTTGETRGLRNSVLASEIDLLKDKNNVLERTKALEKALENTGFKGMSEYESAANELEEFKGHFQKAFADLGTIITSIVQPLMNFYNTLDTLLGSRLSQLIIIGSVLLVTFFTVVGGGILLFAVMSQSLEVLAMNVSAWVQIINTSTSAQMFFNQALKNALGLEALNKIAVDGSVRAGLSQAATKLKVLIATRLNIAENERETISIWGLTSATLSHLKVKVLRIASTIKGIILGVEESKVELARILIEYEALGVAIASEDVEEAKRILRIQNIRLSIVERIHKVKSIITDLWEIVVKGNLNVITAESVIGKFLETLATMGLISVTFTDAGVQILDAEGKEINTVATLGLAVATGILDAVLSPLVITILAIVAVILALIIVIEKLGEAFGWWEDLGSMFQAIGDGINRMWNAFMNSDIIQGIMQYFGDFFDTIKNLFISIQKMFGLIFGWDDDDSGTFDLVQSIIDIFGQLGEAIKWVWNLLDDWSNSPLGIVTWLNPLGILLFHLDEIGSFLEDLWDAIDRFTQTSEFTEMVSEFWKAIDELKEPFMEIWDLISEIIGLFSEIFSSEDPEGQGTEDRINFLVELLKGLATVIRVVVIPVIKGLAFILRIVTLPIRIILTLVKALLGGIQSLTKGGNVFANIWGGIAWLLGSVGDAIKSLTQRGSVFGGIWGGIAWILEGVVNALKQIGNAIFQAMNLIYKSDIGRIFDSIAKTIKNCVIGLIDLISKVVGAIKIVDLFGAMWYAITYPIESVRNLVSSVVDWIMQFEEVIRNSFIGKILGWNKKQDNTEQDSKGSGLDSIRHHVSNDPYGKQNSIANNESMRNIANMQNSYNNVNDVRNLGRTYNSTNNQKQVVINQNFSEGSMPIDARNMTKKEARKMFIGAFGYRRAVGYNGILR